MRIVVVGGGVAGCSAALVAKQVGGGEVVLLERTDMLGGLANVAGIGLCGSGAFLILEEQRVLGGASLYNEVLLPLATWSELTMPGFDRAMLYNVTRLDGRLQRVLRERGVEIRCESHVTGVRRQDYRITSVKLANGDEVTGCVFVDATGSTQGLRGCRENGYGCVECILRCPHFGNTGGLVDNEITTISTRNAWGTNGVLGTSLLLPIASLSDELQVQIKDKGFTYLKVPAGIAPDMKRARLAGSHGMAIMSQAEVKENLLLPDVGGYVKATANASPRYASQLRKLPGLEECLIAQPLEGRKGHLVYGLGMLPTGATQQVQGYENLLCAGTKSSHALFIMDVVLSGDLAGLNAARMIHGRPCLELPNSLMTGAFLAYSRESKSTPEGLASIPQGDRATLGRLGVLRQNSSEIREAVDKVDLADVYRTAIS